MCTKEVFDKVEELKDYCVATIIEELGFCVVYQECIPLGKKAMGIPDLSTIVVSNNLAEQEERNALLHEIGHLLFGRNTYLSNQHAEENKANLFMCLYLVHNEIWESEYFDTYLIYKGVSPRIARQFNDWIWQFKHQQIMENGLYYQCEAY